MMEKTMSKLDTKVPVFTQASKLFVFDVGIVPNSTVAPDWRCDVDNGDILWADTYNDLKNIIDVDYGVRLNFGD
jgi:hypothetical protein